ncbi:3-methyl-2-oxobutanoate hydroxymethyltransferase [Agitococcus lubricus]|uniref:3-methyl-2-oxobutanoate hydroxymethyltransferase n=1 Tax=Agitococcus lubricus TaxID=1077255 RepID=A0A2T5IVC5_9GAMM|nr:3-methyl-2-oxobutanoate hydroxymethyltransferase [Agitococcus lubricus]PTQ87839.1 ketopantoate hydroxymethyltransferase [Agitococcus lubricus]
MPVSLTTLRAMKQRGEKFAMITCYDTIFAQTMNAAGVECLLVGDSLGMVLQGHDSTLPVTMQDMIYHTQCVARGNSNAFLLADMPFMSYGTPNDALENAAALMRVGAHAVKLEGGAWLADTVSQMARCGIPCCVHMGLTPQSVHVFGGYKVQGKTPDAAAKLIEDAKIVEQAGAALILLECVPTAVAAQVTASVSIPVIGIGAGKDCDGQVLVVHDMLGLHQGKPARFVKNFLVGQTSIQDAFVAYVQAVKTQSYPAPEHGFN